jgi:SSS family solute:Na+ symporter
MITGLDLSVFGLYFILVSAYGIYVYRRKANTQNNTKDFFLAEGSLTWWAIGASLIASNISAEQFIGMSGSGFALGLAIASYEWMAAATLIIVAVFFIPIYLKNKIYTMPQFLAQRFDNRVSLIMAVFWLLLYVLVNLTSILYLGSLSLEKMLGVPFMYCAVGLTAFAIVITLGGMRVIGYTDVIQVFFLVLGGLATTYLALNMVSDNAGTGSGVMEGLSLLLEKAPDHFHMILEKGKFAVHDGQGGMQDSWEQLPGLAVLIGGMWIANLSYWGCNQYITQRALGADLKTARNGILFAAFLKLLMPVIVVLPGIACYVLFNADVDPVIKQGMLEDGIVKPDNSYPILLNLLPSGLKGLAFAALTAAIVASLAGKANSISTIFSLDLYKKYINTSADDKTVVRFGRGVVVVSFLIALIICPSLKNFGQGLTYIQEYTGFISPGVLAIFLTGFFWKKATGNAALLAALLSIPLSTAFKFMAPEIPFMNRMGWVFMICIALIALVSLIEAKGKDSSKALAIDKAMFKVSPAFTINALLIFGILAALYIVFY